MDAQNPTPTDAAQVPTDTEFAASILRELAGNADLPPQARVAACEALRRLEAPVPTEAPKPAPVISIDPSKLPPADAAMLRDVLLPEVARMADVAGDVENHLERLSVPELAVLEFLIAKSDGPGSLRALGDRPVFEPEEADELAELFRKAAHLIDQGAPICRRARGLPDDRPAHLPKNVVSLAKKGGKP